MEVPSSFDQSEVRRTHVTTQNHEQFCFQSETFSHADELLAQTKSIRFCI